MAVLVNFTSSFRHSPASIFIGYLFKKIPVSGLRNTQECCNPRIFTMSTVWKHFANRNVIIYSRIFGEDVEIFWNLTLWTTVHGVFWLSQGLLWGNNTSRYLWVLGLSPGYWHTGLKLRKCANPRDTLWYSRGRIVLLMRHHKLLGQKLSNNMDSGLSTW